MVNIPLFLQCFELRTSRWLAGVLNHQQYSALVKKHIGIVQTTLFQQATNNCLNNEWMISLIIIMMLGVMLTIDHLIIVENIRQIEPKPWNIREIMILWAKSMFKTFWEDFPSSKKHHKPPPRFWRTYDWKTEMIWAVSQQFFLGHWIHKWSSQNQPLRSFKSFWGSASLRRTSTYRHTVMRIDENARKYERYFGPALGRGDVWCPCDCLGMQNIGTFAQFSLKLRKEGLWRIDKIRLIMV